MKIETLNPVDGCNFGCEYCYARKMNERFKWISDWNKQQFFPDRLKKFHTRIPKAFFIDSMSDFAAWEPDWQDKVLRQARINNQNQYLSITKRPQLFVNNNMPRNWWYGVTVTNAADKERINIMRQNVQGCKYHVCFEPVHGDVGELDLIDIDWIEVGAETGLRKDKIVPKKEWLINIIDQAEALNIPIMMKESIKTIVGDRWHSETPFDRM